jgi:hypothetical protein
MKDEIIALLLVVAVLAGVGPGYLVGNANERTITTTSTFTEVSTTTTTSVITSTTAGVSTIALPCGSPGVYCGGFNITSASLTVNGNYSVLQVTLNEIGNMYIGSATVYINGTVIGVPPASQYEPPGNVILNVTSAQPAVLVLTIPNSTIPIHPGMTYSVMVYAWEGPPGGYANSGGPTSINVTAT